MNKKYLTSKIDNTFHFLLTHVLQEDSKSLLRDVNIQINGSSFLFNALNSLQNKLWFSKKHYVKQNEAAINNIHGIVRDCSPYAAHYDYLNHTIFIGQKALNPNLDSFLSQLSSDEIVDYYFLHELGHHVHQYEDPTILNISNINSNKLSTHEIQLNRSLLALQGEIFADVFALLVMGKKNPEKLNKYIAIVGAERSNEQKNSELLYMANSPDSETHPHFTYFSHYTTHGLLELPEYLKNHSLDISLLSFEEITPICAAMEYIGINQTKYIVNKKHNIWDDNPNNDDLDKQWIEELDEHNKRSQRHEPFLSLKQKNFLKQYIFG